MLIKAYSASVRAEALAVISDLWEYAMQQFSTKAFIAALLLASPMAGAEPQYPAADFSPVIIFQDTALIAKHAEDAKERAAVVQAKPSVGGQSQSAPSIAPVEEAKPAAGGAQSTSPLTDNLPVVLIALALVGFSFWPGKRPGAKQGESRYASRVSAGEVRGESGVARYLRALPENAKAKETGVARYVKSLPDKSKSADTGVARYLKNLK